jgi:hypothetical protein
VLAVIAEVERLGPTREEFCALPRQMRFGLGWREFRASSHYRSILALPLRAGEENALKLRGVLSIDVKADGHDADPD